MALFNSVPDANEFIASLIARQATLQAAPLSALERKMLYFSETGWTLPDMVQTVADFERDCVEADYEKKITTLIGTRLKDLKKAWCEAVRILRQEDRYVLVMIDG